jgi:hypothetical protein
MVTEVVVPPPPIHAADAGAASPEPFAAAPDIDFTRWNSVSAVCHPDERWDDKKGCVGTSAAKKLRCGVERDQREATSCRPNDLNCVMRASRHGPRRRIPSWGEPATVPELADCAKQCDAGHAPCCLRLGMAYLRGTGIQKEPERGIGYVEKSCLGGYASACASLFHLYQWVPDARSHSLATRLVVAQCQKQMHEHLSCSQAAEAYANGWGVPQDLKRARDYRRIACDRVTATCSADARIKKLPEAARDSAIKQCAEEARVCDPAR